MSSPRTGVTSSHPRASLGPRVAPYTREVPHGQLVALLFHKGVALASCKVIPFFSSGAYASATPISSTPVPRPPQGPGPQPRGQQRRAGSGGPGLAEEAPAVGEHDTAVLHTLTGHPVSTPPGLPHVAWNR